MLVHNVPIPVTTLTESNIKNNPGFIEFLSLLGHSKRHSDYLGLPALAQSKGLTNNFMYTGLQLAAPPFEEPFFFFIGRSYERQTT